jgi:hypothetical protein
MAMFVYWIIRCYITTVLANTDRECLGVPIESGFEQNFHKRKLFFNSMLLATLPKKSTWANSNGGIYSAVREIKPGS